MIRVINNKEEEPTLYRSMCDNCGVELEYEKDDTYIGALGGRELICPFCGKPVYVEQPDGIDLNHSNIEFPKHFLPPTDDAIDIDDEEIQKWIRELLCKAESSEEEYVYYIEGMGNAIVFVFKYVDEYVVYVTNKYWECSIPR
jgi:hypothetical protein